MADSQTSVALNIGSQRVSVAVFESSKSGALTLKGYDSETIVADPLLDASRMSQVRVAIADLVQRLKLGKVKARYAISGQSVFTRFVKLPPLQDDNSLEQLVTFEAQQHVPFPLNEVVWDYELIEGAAEKEVVIVAIKADALDEINSTVNEGGLGTSEVDIAPMALYNAFRSVYGYPEEPLLLIDIGAKASDLIYIEGKRFFARSIPIGGASVTAAIAKEYGVSFQEAERQKVSNGLVALGGGHTEQMDEEVAALAMVIRNALGRLPAEITLTTNYYRSKLGGSAPRSVLLAGGGANLPYTLEFFQEKLNLPVSYFNPVRNIELASGVEPSLVQREGHLMGELVGLGLRGVGQSEISIDLVPSVVAQSRAAERRKPFLIATAAVFLLGMAIWAAFQHISAEKAMKDVKSMEERQKDLSRLKGPIEGLLKKEADLIQISGAYTKVEADHVQWLDLLSDINGAFASDSVWLTTLQPVYDFDPAKAFDVKAQDGKPQGEDGKTQSTNGQSVVKTDFYGTAYGVSSLLDVKQPVAPASVPQPKGKRGPALPQAAAPTVPVANAVRIRGFWRENPRSQNLVSDLVGNLSKQSTNFRFVFPDPNDPKKTINIADHLNRFLHVESVAKAPGELAQSFDITLPLVRGVAIK